MRVQWIIILSLLTLVASAQSDRTKGVEKQKKMLLTEIYNTTKLLDENKQATRNVLSRLNLINKQIDARKQLINILEKEITILDEETLLKNSEIENLEKQLKLKKDNYAASVQKIYKHKNNQDPLLFILSANDFVQSFHRTLYLKKYTAWNKNQTEEIIRHQNIINTERSMLNAQKREKAELVEDRKKEELQLRKEEEVQKTEAADLKKDAGKLQAEINKKKQQMELLNKEIERMISEEVAASRKAAKAQPKVVRKAETTNGFLMTKEELSLSSNFAQNKGNLPFPLKGSYKIVSHFGKQSYAGTGMKNVVSNSNGIEIETTQGNVARAVFDGIVSAVSIIPGFQTSVIIKHGNYITFYSYLDQLYVKKGDTVKAGQNIGKIYSGDSTILYFELRKERTKINPEPWFKR
jgi:septal ring factor EnvC (AmiA/AmiB activator)